jgi:adenylate cyclase
MEQTFELRIGIATGYCTVGNFGSEDRMDYTVIGNPVNLAARLQTHAETGTILLDQEAFSLTQGTIASKDRGTVRVQGFTRPIHIYEVEGARDELPHARRMITLEDTGVRMSIDRGKLSRAAKKKTIKALEDAIRQLKD